MKKSNVLRKAKESAKRQRQREINELKEIRESKKEIRESKKKIGEVITKEDYHPSGHIRHGK